MKKSQEKNHPYRSYDRIHKHMEFTKIPEETERFLIIFYSVFSR